MKGRAIYEGISSGSIIFTGLGSTSRMGLLLNSLMALSIIWRAASDGIPYLPIILCQITSSGTPVTSISRIRRCIDPVESEGEGSSALDLARPVSYSSFRMRELRILVFSSISPSISSLGRGLAGPTESVFESASLNFNSNCGQYVVNTWSKIRTSREPTPRVPFRVRTRPNILSRVGKV